MAVILKQVALAACLAGCASYAAAGPTPPPRLANAVAEASAASGLPRELIERVIAVESGGDPLAVSPAGALGLMQLMPGTWRELRLRLRLGSDPFDVHDNVLAGAAYLREMLDRFGETGFLAAYNAGPARYAAARTGRVRLPRETVHYVAAFGFGPSGTPGGGWPASPLAPTGTTLFVGGARP